MDGESGNFRQSDITAWAITALVCGAFAVLSANITAALPVGAMTELHATRLDGGNMNLLRREILQIRAQLAEIRRSNDSFDTRLSLTEQARNGVAQRVGALERVVPAIIETFPAEQGIDRTAITASVGENKAAISFDAEGGSVSVQQEPLFTGDIPLQADTELPPIQQELPEQHLRSEPASAAPPRPAGFGVALGLPVEPEMASSTWYDFRRKIGTLLLGLDPLLSGTGENQTGRIIAGPIFDYAMAEELCNRVAKAEIACLPVSYSGSPLPQPIVTPRAGH